MDKKFIARLFDELEPCYPDSKVSKGVTEYNVSCANNTYSGVNILISGLTPGIPLTVKVEGEHTGFKLFNMIPVPVEVNTGAKLRSEYLKNDTNEHVIRKAPFMVYDALEPFYNIIMPTITTCGIHFKSINEYCTKNCRQDWKLTIIHGDDTQILNFRVNIYCVPVPKASKDTFKYINWFSLNNIASYHNISKWSPEFEIMLEKYLRVAVHSRQNMINIDFEEFFDMEDDKPILNTSRLEKFINIAKKSGITWFQGGALASREEFVVDNDDFYNSLDHNSIVHTDQVADAFKEKAFDLFDNGTTAITILTYQSIQSPQGKDTLKDISKQIYTFIKEHNLEEVYYQCALDEPNDALSDTYKLITSIIRDNMKDIPILEPVLPTEKITGCLDIWCPSLDIYEQNRSFYDEQVEKGDELFVYSCLTPGGNYLNRLLDMERIRMVLLGWAPAKYTNIKGFLHWGANQYVGINPFARQATMFQEQVLEFHPKRANFLPSGDCCIFYPGYNEPLISIRSEAHRIGLEDLYLLRQLALIDENKKNDIVSKVFRGFDDYEKSISTYRETKKLLLEKVSISFAQK